MGGLEFLSRFNVLQREYWPGLARTYLQPVAAICLSSSPYVGIGLWLVLLMQPPIALAAFLALSFFQLLEILFEQREQDGTFDLSLRSNGLLSALAGTWIFLPSQASPLLAVTMISGVVLSSMLLTFLAKDVVFKSRLPALVWPYCTVAVIALTVFPDAAARSVVYFEWPVFEAEFLTDLPEVFLRSLGVFLFTPLPVAGILIVGVLFVWSPALVMAGLTGWLFGCGVSALLVAAGAPVFWAETSYNFFLSGAALGAVFFVPGACGLAFAAMGGSLAAVIASMLQIMLAYSTVSYLPIPFAVTLYSGLLLFSSPPFGVSTDIVRAWACRPEDNRVARNWLRARWGQGETPLLAVPVQGVLEITQGFDGGLSHRGNWQHALDFQRPIPPGGTADTRPSLWAEPVFAPIDGRVLSVVSAVPDNALGQVNFADNWGNHVVIEARSGVRVLLAHLMQYSLVSGPGQAVGFATQIGLVGNSGRSSVPHLHLHAQKGDLAGAPTRDFRLANFFVCSPETQMAVEWRASSHVMQGDLVMAATPNLEIRALLSGILPGRGVWAASDVGPIVLDTSVLEDGQFKLQADAKGWMTLALDFDGLRVTALDAPAGSFVSQLALCLSTIPYSAFAGLCWTDWLPRTFRGHWDRFPGQLDLRADALLDTIDLTAEASPGEDGPGTTIRAKPRSHHAGLPQSCTVTIMPQRGPTRMLVQYENGTREYQQISFEPHER